MNKEKFLIHKENTLREALESIEENKHGIIFIADQNKQIIAMLTDGDIRRSILEGFSLDSMAFECSNKNFFWESQGVSRERLLKKLNHQIKVIPILDEDMRLVEIVSRDYIPSQDEQSIYVQSKAPVRVSFGGGGSDLTHFFENDPGAVINTTISLYSHCTLKKRFDNKINIHSLDLEDSLEANDLEDALEMPKKNFGLIQALLKTIRPQFGFDLYIYSDFPMSSGLGGSSAVSAAILGCFNGFREDEWGLHDLAELAYQAERLYQGVEGGWQDQYATVFGGFNFMEFKMEQNIIHPLRLQPEVMNRLENSLLLCDTTLDHHSGNIHKDQRKQMERKDIQSHVKENVELCFKMRNQLLRGMLDDFGESLNEAWDLKRKLSKEISNSHIDKIYLEAIQNGATGGKLLGAGGGGYFIFFVNPFNRAKLIRHFKESNVNIRPFSFESTGLITWKVRDR